MKCSDPISYQRCSELVFYLGTFLRLPPPWWIYKLLLIEVMLHLSHLKQMYSQPIDLTHKLIFYLQMFTRRVDFNGDSTVKSPCWHQVLNL